MGIRLVVAGQRRVFSLPSPPPSSLSTRQHQCSPNSALQCLEQDASEMENGKMTTGIKLGRYLPNETKSLSNSEDVSVHCRSITASPSLHFNLLYENVNKIEHILADEDSVRLEREILNHIRRLGALKLFHACLSRTIMLLAEVIPNPQQTDHFRYFPEEYLVKQDKVVPSGKKEERKLRRSVAKEKSSIAISYPSNCKRVSISLDTHQANSRCTIARNESKFSIAVKDVALLENIRLKLLMESGEEVSHERWAEAAGIDLKTLLQRLHVGWHSRDKLLRSTRSLVVFLARNYKGIGVPFDDLLQAGSMGVLKGAERFDNSRGYRFSTYVQYWIRKSMLSFITRYSRGIQLPATMVRIIKRAQDARKIFGMREGRFPVDAEVADLTNLPLATVRLARRCSRAVGSLDHWPIADIIEMTPDTSVETPFEFFTKVSRKRRIAELLESLHPRERQVLILRFGLDDGRRKSLGEIGSLCNVSKEWVRRIERAAMANIRNRDAQETGLPGRERLADEIWE